MTVKPAGNSWTEFQVTDVDGRVQIAANKGDVTVQDEKGTTTRPARTADHARRHERSGERRRKSARRGSGHGGGGGIMSSSAAIYTGLAHCRRRHDLGVCLQGDESAESGLSHRIPANESALSERLNPCRATFPTEISTGS